MNKKFQMAVLGAGLVFSSLTVAQENVGNKLITIAENTPYLDETLVQENVLKECTAVIPPKRAASKSRINTSPAFSAGRVSLLKPSYAFALE